MNNKKITYKIASTGLSVGFIVIAQLIGKILPSGFSILGPFSFNQLLTGSLVNMILILLTFQSGLYSAIVAGCLSSVMAMLLQIGPIFPQIVIFIALANVILVTLVYFISSISKPVNIYFLIFAVIIAGLIKFLFLKFTIPLSFKIINDISDVQIKVLTIMFSWPQLVTSLIGGFTALIINKLINKNSIKD